MSYLHTLEFDGVVVTLRPRSLLTEEIERALRMDCLLLLTKADEEGNLIVQPLLDEFGISEEDLLHIAIYLWVLSPRVAKIEGVDFELITRADTDEKRIEKMRAFMASQHYDVMVAIDQAITQMDKPADPELAPNPVGLTDEQKKTEQPSKASI